METGDRKLNEVTKVTDMAYVPVIMADGSIGQIAKSDLASVVAGQMTASKLYPFADRGDLNISANDVNQNGSYSIMGKGTTLDLPLDYGTLVSFNMGGYFAVQICTLSSTVYVRGRDNGVWSPWCKLQTL